jgi:hypothetical protein
VVEYLTQNCKVVGLNPATSTGREKMFPKLFAADDTNFNKKLSRLAITITDPQ